ncbi:hypothetical protein FRB99_006679, partial [Tulasnella sp. 403]
MQCPPCSFLCVPHDALVWLIWSVYILQRHAPHYVSNNLSLYQPEMCKYTQMLLQKMDAYEGKKAFDCLTLFRRLLVDVIFVLSYGQRIDSLKQWDTDTFQEDPVSGIVISMSRSG